MPTDIPEDLKAARVAFDSFCDAQIRYVTLKLENHPENELEMARLDREKARKALYEKMDRLD